RPKTVDSSWERELRGTAPLHEIPAADSARLLHGAEHWVEGGKPARHTLSSDGFTGEHAVTLEERLRERDAPLGHAHASVVGREQRPPSLRARRHEAHQRAARVAAHRTEKTQRLQGVVG